MLSETPYFVAKDTILKAIHNCSPATVTLGFVAKDTILKAIHNDFESELNEIEVAKDTILKAIHNETLFFYLCFFIFFT